MNRLAVRLLASLGLAVVATCAYAQKFTAPEQMIFQGKTYKLAFKSAAPDGKELYEYTTNDEAIEKWSTLITLNYFKPLPVTPLKWALAMQESLDREKPKPHYSLYVKGANGYAKIIYEPDARNPSYESNVHKTFHVDACGGRVVYQFAQKYPLIENPSSEAKLELLKKIAAENGQFATEMEKSDWQPQCGP